MIDFVSQATLDADAAIPDDALDHHQQAQLLCEKLAFLPSNAVVALQGEWGRGKTDVLLRTRRLLEKDDGIAQHVLWINPWQYGTPDLLSPVVYALLNRIPRSKRKEVKRAALTVLEAGLSFGVKAAELSIPGGQLLTEAANTFTKALDKFFQPTNEGFDPDPVAAMATRFRELVDALITKDGPKRIVVCVDDLDRCLPHRQVAHLEAICFLVSAKAPVTFLIAIDPTLARESVVAHYGTHSFDADRYLDKMFHLRLTLPAVTFNEVKALMSYYLAQRPGTMQDRQNTGEELTAVFGSADLPELASKVLIVPDVRNPRIVQRMCERLRLLAVHLHHYPTSNQIHESQAILATAWLAIFERWPVVREVIQDAGEDQYDRRLKDLMRNLTKPDTTGGRAAILRRVPRPDEDPSLHQMLRIVTEFGDGPNSDAKISEAARTFTLIDRQFRAAGL